MNIKAPTRYTQERPRVARYAHPSLTQRRLDAFHLPQVTEQLQVFNHAPRIDNSVYWRIDLVFQGEHVPPNLTMCILKHARVQSSQDVWRIVLCIRRTDGSLESSGKVMSEQGICWPR